MISRFFFPESCKNQRFWRDWKLQICICTFFCISCSMSVFRYTSNLVYNGQNHGCHNFSAVDLISKKQYLDLIKNLRNFRFYGFLVKRLRFEKTSSKLLKFCSVVLCRLCRFRGNKPSLILSHVMNFEVWLNILHQGD